MKEVVQKLVGEFKNNFRLQPYSYTRNNAPANGVLHTHCLIFSNKEEDPEQVAGLLDVYREAMPHFFDVFGFKNNTLAQNHVLAEIERLLKGNSSVSGFLEVHDADKELQYQSALVEIRFIQDPEFRSIDMVVAVVVMILKPGHDEYEVVKTFDLVDIR